MSTTRLRFLVAAIVAGILLLVGGVALGRATAPSGQAAPSSTSAEAGFARDMQTHHLQAVQLAMTIREKSDNPEILGLAYDIATSQAQQSGQMYGWLVTWGLPQASPEPVMTWMSRPATVGKSSETDHSGMQGMDGMKGMEGMEGMEGMDHSASDATSSGATSMPGYATREQLAALDAATGTAADDLFLSLMIAHHKGGVEMADALLARSENTTVVALATSIVTAQSSEITYMEGLLSS